MLRRALDERTLAPRARRWVGSTIAALIVVAALAGGALWLTQSAAGRAFRREISGGYEEGRRDGRAARAAARAARPADAPVEVVPVVPAAPAAPTPPAPPAPRPSNP